jgi:hypothetical protein
MPNHIHFIIHKIDTTTMRPDMRSDTVGADRCFRPKENKNSTNETKKGEHTGSPLRKIEKNDEQIVENEKNVGYIVRSSLPKIMQWFKTMTTNEYIRRIK